LLGTQATECLIGPTMELEEGTTVAVLHDFDLEPPNIPCRTGILQRFVGGLFGRKPDGNMLLRSGLALAIGSLGSRQHATQAPVAKAGDHPPNSVDVYQVDTH
jgi:hypothetical protein